jgi:DTW domain-containing protein YfiP
MSVAVAPARCLGCGRPSALCWCRDLTPIPTRTRVVILQHPRERTMRMNTARLAHVGLDRAELHVGVRFDDEPWLRELAHEPSGRVALLYPGDDTADAEGSLDVPPRTLVVVDGTWTTARKMLARSPLLRSLPRISLRPAAPSAYRIRREPAAHCLSTVEAIVAALTQLEGDGARFAPLLAVFDRLVENQIACANLHRIPFRHDRKRRRLRRASPVEAALAADPARIVVVQAEGNPHHDGGPHELVHLVACRPATGARFDVVVRPHCAVAPRMPARLGLDAAALDRGVAMTELVAAWSGFVGADDVLVGWGRFTPTVLETSGIPCPSWIDLRGEVARRLGRGAGGSEAACTAIGARPETPWAPGRAGERVAALVGLVAALGGSQSPADAVPERS